jgi:hypothetical protein
MSEVRAVPAGVWPDQRSVAGRLIRYRIDRSPGGSGGTQFDLTAWEPCALGYVEYRQSDVAEVFEPDFALLLLVIEGTRPT